MAILSTSVAVATAYGVNESDSGTIATTTSTAIANRKLYLCSGELNQLRHRSIRKSAVIAVIAIRNVSLLVSRPTMKDSRQLNSPAMRPRPLDDRARWRDSGVSTAQLRASWLGFSDQPRNRSQYQGSTDGRLMRPQPAESWRTSAMFQNASRSHRVWRRARSASIVAVMEQAIAATSR